MPASKHLKLFFFSKIFRFYKHPNQEINILRCLRGKGKINAEEKKGGKTNTTESLTFFEIILRTSFACEHTINAKLTGR